jgi:Helix-turn-helix
MVRRFNQFDRPSLPAWTCANWSAWNFAQIRCVKGLTEEQMEELSGFSQQYISRLEQGRRNPTEVTL